MSVNDTIATACAAVIAALNGINPTPVRRNEVHVGYQVELPGGQLTLVMVNVHDQVVQVNLPTHRAA